MSTYSPNSRYHIRNLESIDEKYKCRICRSILKDPVQMTCGHRVCYQCIQIENKVVRCSECSEITLSSQITPDKGFHNDMQTLPIGCISCEWSGHLKNYQNHLEQSHNQYRCSHCNEIFQSLPLLDQHKQTTCPQIYVDCTLQQYGCTKKIRRCNQSRHYLDVVHQQTILSSLLKLVTDITEGNQKSTCFGTHIERETIDLPSKVTTASSTYLVTDEYNAPEDYISDTVITLSGGVETLHDDLKRLSSESLQQSQLVQMMDQQLLSLKTSVEETNVALNAISANIGILQQECFSLKHKIQEKQSISYDGTLVWKISNVQEKMTDAQSERQVSIYSPPFYSSTTGYKMCARLYLHGDGNARRTHISLFFVLMRGLHDQLLPFPFSYKVTFCLFDQTVQQRHIIDSFRPDSKSNSFQRPRCDMNIASGIPKFVDLSVIEQLDNPYVKDDTMFIKVMVDFGNLPKTMLTYALSLNPGLPTHCQQRMIQQEIERRARSQSQQMSQTNLTNKERKPTDNSLVNNQQYFDDGNPMKK